MSARRLTLGLTIGVLVVLAAGVPVASGHSRVAYSASDPVLSSVDTARVRGHISGGQAARYRRIYLDAERWVGRLRGRRGRELASALGIVRGIAARGSLTASRMPLVFLTLQRNVRWWSSHGAPTAGSGGEPGISQRHCHPPASADARAANVTFAGSGVVFEYYPGLGLQLQVNATFGSAAAMLHYGSQRQAEQAGTILEQMLPLASQRAGLLTWEYEFPFEGAKPPWTSGLSQATAINAYVRAAKRLHRPDFLRAALRLARLFTVTPPVGVQVHLAHGPWFLLYSFNPGELVLNADLDSLIALHELRVATRSPWVTALVHRGLRSLEHYLPRLDTGRWSYYALGGPLADLNYHVLNLELAQQLCQLTGVRSVCHAARSFNRELNARCPIVTPAVDQRASGPEAFPRLLAAEL